jgi:hypothetical protein
MLSSVFKENMFAKLRSGKPLVRLIHKNLQNSNQEAFVADEIREERS